MRAQKALANIITSFALQLITAICGFIVSRHILVAYGSDVNGLVSSITQFLGYIALVEGGVGGVIRAALYKPLAKNETYELSGIVKATEIFFRKVAFIFICYMIVLAIVYPFVVRNSFNWVYTATLVVILGMSTFAQYYFGITYQTLLQADQKNYITKLVRLLTVIVNTILIVVLVKCGASVHIVRFGSSLIFILRPLLLNLYVNRKYDIIKECTPDNKAISQRWSGLGHHVSFFVHKNTDVVVLTLFTNIKLVSIYAIHHMIIML